MVNLSCTSEGYVPPPAPGNASSGLSGGVIAAIVCSVVGGVVLLAVIGVYINARIQRRRRSDVSATSCACMCGQHWCVQPFAFFRSSC